MRKCKIGIVGFGTVGSGIYKILSSEVDSHPILKEIEIAKIAVKDLNKKRGIDLDNNLLTDDPLKLGISVVTANKAVIARYGE